MTRNKKPRKAYRPRPVALDTMTLARHFAAKPAREDRDEVLGKLREAIHALCSNVGTALDWSIAAGALAVAQAIERRGIVRGLSEHLGTIEVVLQAIHDRCHHPKLWLRPALTIDEADALRLLLELHTFQVDQLGRAEFIAAIEAAERDTRAQGHQTTLARDLDRVAA